MFIRFSDQEDINDLCTICNQTQQVTQRLQDGTKIIGAIKAKEVILSLDR